MCRKLKSAVKLFVVSNCQIFQSVKFSGVKLFSPLSLLKCVIILPSWIDTKSHWLHLFLTTVPFKNVSSNCLPALIQNHTSHTCMNFMTPHCIVKCFLQLPPWIDTKSHWSHFLDFIYFALSNVS